MTNEKESAQAFLEAAYQDLDLANGVLLDAVDRPLGRMLREWLDKGEWLLLAKKVGAEKVFFVDNNPVVVFAKHDTDDAEVLRQTFNNTWCMARPPLLFLAKPARLCRILPSTGLPPWYYEGIINRLQTFNLRILSNFQQKSQSH